MDGDITREHLRCASANTIRVLRKRVGLAQDRFAYEAGVNRGFMGRLEQQRSTPTLETIYKLLPLLKISFTEFAAEFERQLKRCRRQR